MEGSDHGRIERADGGTLNNTHPDAVVRQRLEKFLSSSEYVLRAALDRARAGHDHRGNKGDLVEEAVRFFLRNHLPARLDVGHGTVIDKFGSFSKQMDVVVIDEDHPFRYESGSVGTYLAEGVVAAAEVKASLGSSQLVDMLDKGSALRALRPVQPNGSMRMGTSESDTHRFYVSPPYFGVAFETTLSAETILQTLKKYPDPPSPEGEGRTIPALDALFTLDRGVFINLWDGRGDFFLADESGNRISGWCWLGQDDPLVRLFTWLHAVMPRIQRWTSIALPYLIPHTNPSGSSGQ